MLKSGRALRTVAVMLSAGALLALSFTDAPHHASAAPAPMAAAGDEDWLQIVNGYRAMSGLAPVVENGSWSAGALSHSCYMLYNGISHDEIPGYTGYTAGGDTAGNSGNVAVSSNVAETARGHVELWMTGPFHAIGILRHNLASTGFGKCASSSTSPWKSGATLDVLRGLSSAPRPSTATVFPGRNATVRLTRFITESPNPLDFCPGYSTAGLPIIALMPAGVSSASATLSGPSGPLQQCVLHPGNTSGLAQQLLAGDNAVVVIPRSTLSSGTHNVTVNTNAGAVSWSFTVNPNAGVAPPTVPTPDTFPLGGSTKFQPVTPFRFADSRLGQRAVRLTANQPQRIQIAGQAGLPNGMTAVSANFTVTDPSGAGYLTVYNCAAKVPEVSTLNFTAAAPVPNQAVVPLDSSGGLCVFSPAGAHVIVDVNGFFKGSASNHLTAFTPVRILDTRSNGQVRLAANKTRTVQVEGGSSGVPAAATAVAVNLTVVGPSGIGYLQAFPCNQAKAPSVSNVNFGAGEVRPNSAIVPTSPSGTICLRSTVATDVLVDVSGYVRPTSGLVFTPLQPTRMLDTRFAQTAINPTTGGQRLSAGTHATIRLAGKRGVPAAAKAVSINITAVDPAGGGFVTAYPCGTVPGVSNVNTSPYVSAVANGAMVRLSSAGDLCVYASQTTHILVDINGFWS